MIERFESFAILQHSMSQRSEIRNRKKMPLSRRVVFVDMFVYLPKVTLCANFGGLT